MKKRFLIGLLIPAMLLALLPTAIFAEETDFGVGDTGTAKIAPSSGVSVYKSPNSMVESNKFPVGTAVNVLEAYVTENRHYVEATSGMMKGKKGYIDARKGDTNTLKSINITGKVDKTYGEKKAEQEAKKKAQEKAESKYTHDIDLEYLKDYMPGGAKSPNGSGIASLGSPIGVMVIDSPWRAYGEATYTASQLEQKKKYMGATKEEQKSLKNPVGKKMVENEWANVYKVEEYAYTLYSWSGSQEKTATIYTIVFNGEVRYVFDDGRAPGFTYYPGNGYSKQTTANTQKIYVDLNEYNVQAYNINGNNYFKIRDIAKMMEGTSKIFDIEYDAGTNSINMIGYFDYTEAGGELAKGDGTEKTAFASSAFLTYDGVPVSVACYNIDGNNYFKLRDVTDALDCRVEWNSRNNVINIITTLSAKEDPNEAKG